MKFFTKITWLLSLCLLFSFKNTIYAQDADMDGFTVAQGDCDDGDDSIYPDAMEIPCNGIDENCDPSDDNIPSWNQIIKAVADNREVGDWFGWSVAIDGDYAVIGVPFKDGNTVGGTAVNRAGGAYVFKYSGTTWNLQSILRADDMEFNDRLGLSVAIDGDYVILGTTFKTINGKFQAGAAYIFNRVGTSWNQQAKITADDFDTADVFGTSVSIDGEYAVVGATGEDVDIVGGNTLFSVGAAYVFKRNGNTWNQEAKLMSNDRDSEDFFGRSVSIDGEYIIIGAPSEDEDANGGNTLFRAGSAYIFKRNGSLWNEQAKLVPDNRGEEDFFGLSVDIDGELVIIGAPRESPQFNKKGTAYIFRRDGNIWSQEASLTGDDFSFATSVAIKGDYAIVGDPDEDFPSNISNSQENAGAAYIFKNTGNIWNREAKVIDDLPRDENQFGISVDIDGNRILVGAHEVDSDENGANFVSNAGAAYIFEPSSCGTQIYYVDSDGDSFGDASNFIMDNTPPVGYVIDNTDCNDNDNTIYPNAPELCDGKDNDCNGLEDDGLPTQTYFIDADGDGFGDLSTVIEACSQPVGYVLQGGDCVDTDASINPNATEICGNNIDEDCDGDTCQITVNPCDLQNGLISYHTFSGNTNDDTGNGHDAVNSNNVLATEDRFGNPNSAFDFDENGPIEVTGNVNDYRFNNQSITLSCWVTLENNDNDYDGFIGIGDSGDCSPAIHLRKSRRNILGGRLIMQLGGLNAKSIQSGDAMPKNTWMHVVGTVDNVNKTVNLYVDGVLQESVPFSNNLNFSTTNPFKVSLGNTPCNHPSLPSKHQGKLDDVRIYNRALSTTEIQQLFALESATTTITTGSNQTDADGDGFSELCDCNDNDPTIYPNAPELCDGKDNDCNGLEDDGLPTQTYFADADGDGFGDISTAIEACSQPIGFVLQGGDCMDTNSDIYPNAPELCDGIDNNCNNLVDEVNCVNDTCVGNLNFASQADVNAFQNSGCSVIIGDVTIDGFDITDLGPLSGIVQIIGTLTIGDVNGGNAMLTSLTGLQNLVLCTGDVFILGNPVLTNTDALSGLITIEGCVHIRFNLILTGLGAGFSNLTSIGTEIIIEGMPNFTGFGTAFSSITIIPGNVYFINLPALTDISSFVNVTQIGGTLQLVNCVLLPNLNGFSGLTIIVEDCIFIDVTLIVDFSGFGNLQQIGGTIRIEGSNGLSSLQGLGNITFIGGDLFIIGVPNLNNLDILINLSQITGCVHLIDCVDLTDLNGLSNVTSIGTDLVITGCTGLTDCCGIYNLLINNGVGGNIILSGNAPGCNSEQEIIAACAPNDLVVTCPPNQIVTFPAGSTSGAVNWTIPSATSTCTTGSVNITQTTTLSQGVIQPVNTVLPISYSIIDGCGNQDNCLFTVTTEAPSSGDLQLTCPPNQTVFTPAGQLFAPVIWNDPVATTNCPWGSISMGTSLGYVSGNSFPVGTRTIEYWAYDGCAKTATCNFTVTVERQVLNPDLQITCPDIFTVPRDPSGSTVVTWTTPQIIQGCAGATITQLGGQPSGSSFPDGWTCISYQATDDCNNVENCLFCFEVILGPNNNNKQGNSTLKLIAQKQADKTVDIHWISTADSNIESYLLERSIGDLSFEKIAALDARDSAEGTLETFQITDFEPKLSENHYRITVFYKDGSIRYSNIAKVKFNEIVAFSVYPNPSSESIYVDLSAVEGETVELEFIDVFGKKALQYNVLSAQQAAEKVNISALQEGVYWMAVRSEAGRQQTVKVVVARR